MTDPADHYFLPLDCRCETCGTPPGLRCTWTDAAGLVHFRGPHAARVTCAREASEARRRRLMEQRRGSPWRPS